MSPTSTDIEWILRILDLMRLDYGLVDGTMACQATGGECNIVDELTVIEAIEVNARSSLLTVLKV